MSNLLSVENLTMKFGGLIAIDDLSFDAKNNQITSIKFLQNKAFL